MATGGFKSSATTDFLEEWKAKREKMRARMLGEIAAAAGAGAPPGSGCASGRHAAELPERSASSGNCLPSSDAPAVSPASGRRKAPPQPDKAPCATPDSGSLAGNDTDKESPSPGKSKEKKSGGGPSARKGKGQIEKRKLREKRRSTGVVSIPSNESLDELDDDDAAEKDRREEEELVQANTFQNEAMSADPDAGHLMETPRSTGGGGGGRHKSSAAPPGSEEETGGNTRQRHGRHGRDGGAAAPGGLERRMEELERELARERQENARLLKAHQDKDDLIGKLKEEIDLLNRDLDDIEDENEQLKQENKTLLKVVGQLTR